MNPTLLHRPFWTLIFLTPAIASAGIAARPVANAAEAVAEPPRVAENSHIKIEMDRTGLRRLTDKSRGITYCDAAAVHAPLFELRMKKLGDAPVEPVRPEKNDFRGFQTELVGHDTLRMRMRWELPNRVAVVAEALLLSASQIEWRLAIENHSDRDVAEIYFPLLPGFAVGRRPGDCSVFMPTVWGVATDPTKPAGPYCCVMRWMGHWNAQGGFYLGNEDAQFHDALFLRDPDGGGRWNIGVRQWGRVGPDEKWQSAVIRTAFTSGDWHEMGDLYRAFTAKALARCDYPDHVKWLLDTWDTCDSNLYPQQGFAMLTDGMEKRGALGVYFFATNRQMIEGPMSYSDVGFPPYPCPAWGSEREFRQQLRAASDRGAMIVPYLNYQNYRRFYLQHVRGRDRDVYYPKNRLPAEFGKYDDRWMDAAVTHAYDGTPGNEMAAASPAWADAVAAACRRYNDWGMCGMYLDQACLMTPSGRCYPPRYPAYGENVRARTDLLLRLRSELHAENPYSTLTGEVIIDVMCQALDLPMTSGVFPNLDYYRYCNPTQLMIHGAWNGGYGHWGGADQLRSSWQMGIRFEQMVPRTSFDTGTYAGVAPNTSRDYDDWDRRVLDLRRAVKSILYDAEYRDSVGLSVRDAAGNTLVPERTLPAINLPPQRGVFGRWFHYAKEEQSGAVINIVNAVSPPEMAAALATRELIKSARMPLPPLRGATMTFSTAETGPVRGAVAWTLEGKCFAARGRQEGSRYRFSVPESEMSSVVLSCGQIRPVVAWDLDHVATGGVRRVLKLRITNANAEPMSGAARLLPPVGWPSPEPVAFGPLAHGETARVELPVGVPAGAAHRRYDLRCAVETAQGTFSTYNFVVVSDPVLAEFKGCGDRLQLWFRNLTDQPQQVEVKKLRLPAPLIAMPPRGMFTLAPRDTASIDFTIHRRAQLNEIRDAEADVLAAGRMRTLVHGVMPVVPNGDFEADGAGDRKPDWWIIWELAKHGQRSRRIHMVNPDAIRLDPENPHGGKYSLRMDGLGAEDTNLERRQAVPVNGIFAAGRRYRVSVWIRSPAPDGVWFECCRQRVGQGRTRPEWQQFAVEVTPRVDTYARDGCQLINASTKPAWFDDLRVEDLGPAVGSHP